MKLNCTYRLEDKEGFVGIPGNHSTNERIAKTIEEHGGTIRPVSKEHGVLSEFVLKDGTVVGYPDFYLCAQEHKYFEKVQEGYPEREDEFLVSFTVKNAEQARIAIEMLKKYI